jgi:hypothetical protein
MEQENKEPNKQDSKIMYEGYELLNSTDIFLNKVH